MGSDAMAHGSISELSTMPLWVKSGLVRRSKLSDYPISSSASESGSEVAMHYAFAVCDW